MRRFRTTGFCLFAFLLCSVLFSSPSISHAQGKTVRVLGKVLDPSGTPVRGATIFVDPEIDPSLKATTDESGRFDIGIQSGSKHLLRIQAPGFQTNEVELPSVHAKKVNLNLSLKIAPTGSAAVQFSDSPNFTVAGVTDWSNVGLHGSDVNVKTSEALNKDAAALKSSPGSSPGNSEADAHRILGDEKEEAGDPVAAEREYELAVKLDPSEQNYFSWGTQLLLHRAASAAVDTLTKASALHPNSQRMIEALGAAFYANGQYPEAAQQMCHAADMNPADPEPYLFLGRIEEAAKDSFACSEKTLLRFVSEQPKNADANFYYGLVLFKNARKSQREDDFERAEASFRKAIEDRPAFGEVYVQLGLLYNARGQKDAALREFQNAVHAAPQLIDAHYQLSLAYRRAGDSAKADEEMKKYEELHSAEEEALEKQRKEMKQFVTILQESSPKP